MSLFKSRITHPCGTKFKCTRRYAVKSFLPATQFPGKKVKVTRLCLTLCNPWTTQSMKFSRPKYLSEYPFPSSEDLPNPGIEPRSPALQADSLPAEPQGKLCNTGVGSLSFLQWIFPTQEFNWGLLHCRLILYQLSYLGSPRSLKVTKITNFVSVLQRHLMYS